MFLKYIVSSEDENIRIDRLLAKIKPQYSRNQWQLAIGNSLVLIDNNIIKASDQKVSDGQEIIVVKDLSETTLINVFHKFKKVDKKLTILYEDENLAIINKPSNLVVHPGAGNESDSVCARLLNLYGEKIAKVGAENRPGIVHRLDKNTSGVMVIAKTNDSYLKLSKAFSKHKINKYYLAIVDGIPRLNSDRLENYIKRDPNNRKKMKISNFEGRLALLSCLKLHSYPDEDCSIMLIKLETGRTHQIRAQLANYSHPIIGDEQYNYKSRLYISKEKAIKIKRQLLHSCFIEFQHPVLKKIMNFYSEPATDIKQIIINLNKSQNASNRFDMDLIKSKIIKHNNIVN